MTLEDMDNGPPGNRWDLKTSMMAARLRKTYVPLLPTFQELKVLLVRSFLYYSLLDPSRF